MRWIIPLSFAALCFSAAFPIHNPDFFWHLAIGRWIAESWALPYFEPFAFLAAGARAVPWVGFEWLSELIFYLIWTVAGAAGLIAFKAAMAAATAWVIDGGLRKAGCKPALRAGAICWFALVTQKRWMVEPELFTFLLLALVARRLSARKAPLRAQELVPLAGIFCLWSNLHGGFVYGLGLVFIDIFGSTRGAKKRAAAFFVCLGATFLNPYGWGIYSTVFFLLSRLGELHAQNVEWKSPLVLGGLSVKAVLILPVLGLALLWKKKSRRRKIDLRDLLVVVLFGAWGILTMRGAAVAGVVLVPVAARLFAETFKKPLPRGGLWTLGVVGLWIFMVLEVFALGSPAEGIVWSRTPKRLIEEALKENRPGALLLPFEWAGYAVWKSYPERRVYHYGRLDAFRARIAQRRAARKSPEAWLAFLDKNRIETVIEKHPRRSLPGLLHGPQGEEIRIARSPFYAYFPEDRWTLAAWDDQGLIFFRKAHGKGGYRLLDPHDLSYLRVLKSRGWLDRSRLRREFNRHLRQSGPSRYDPAITALLD